MRKLAIIALVVFILVELLRGFGIARQLYLELSYTPRTHQEQCEDLLDACQEAKERCVPVEPQDFQIQRGM